MRSLLSVIFLPLLAFAAAQVPQNTSSEEMRPEFDLTAAQGAAAKAALEWQTHHDCVTCHTNGLFLIAGAHSRRLQEPYQQSRAFASTYLDRYLKDGRAPVAQHGSVEGIVATSAFLAIGEARARDEVSPKTLEALRHSISRMSEQGHFEKWLRCDWPPYEVDHHFGVSLLLVALGTTPQEFQAEPKVAEGIQRMRTWLENHAPTNAHQAGMCLWADSTGGIELTDAQRMDYITRCRILQREDGGWSVFGIGKWARPDGTPQLKVSEAYATAFMVFILRQAGVPAHDETIKRGLAWLRSNQRISGRWFSRSPRRDRRHYLSNAATNFALLAFESCLPAQEAQQP